MGRQGPAYAEATQAGICPYLNIIESLPEGSNRSSKRWEFEPINGQKIGRIEIIEGKKRDNYLKLREVINPSKKLAIGQKIGRFCFIRNLLKVDLFASSGLYELPQRGCQGEHIEAVS